jgi:hypothetical protein
MRRPVSSATKGGIWPRGHSPGEHGRIFVVLKPKLAQHQPHERLVWGGFRHRDPAMLLLVATIAATAFWAVLVIL